MARYKLLGNSIMDTAAGVIIQQDTGNNDYKQYQSWLALGNTPDPADSLPLAYTTNIPLVNKLRTTDATPTELLRIPLSLQTGYTATSTIIGVDAGNGAVRVVTAAASFKRLNAGALSIGVATIIANHTDAGASTWIASSAVSGNDFIVTVTGAIGRTIDWNISGSMTSFTPGGM